MRPGRAPRAALAGLVLAAGAASGQVPGEGEEARLPYEHLPKHQNEMQFGLSHLERDRSSSRDVRTETASAFMALSRGLSERFELGVLLPYILYSEQTTVNAGRTVREEHRDGFSDPTFRARYALKLEDKTLAVTLGVLATPDWGGRSRSFTAEVDSIEPYAVLGKSLGAAKAYLRYGYARRSGDAPEAHHLTLGGRIPLRSEFGLLGHVSYVRPVASTSTDTPATVGGAIGGYTGLPNGMQLLGWVGAAAFADPNGPRDSRAQHIAFSLVHRF